ncbi:MAG: pilus assembly protein PilP [Betaproteobacteria bacterium]|nr:pilus assembly protein PilP [Betaproteobacteria bacterium]
MKAESQNIRPSIPALPKAVEYRTVVFDALGRLDPFDTTRLDPSSQGFGVAEEMNELLQARLLRNNVLEKYPLESMELIGIMNINRQQLAAIKVDNIVQQVKVGDYIGLDFGLVTAIRDTEITLNEKVEDLADGILTDRMATLYLQTKEEGR